MASRSNPNLNSGAGAHKNYMSADNTLDFTDLYQNEESFDLSCYMSTSPNLELCNDDLFENLFPPTSPSLPADLKKEKFEDFEEELDNWYYTTTSEPPSNCASACSSAAPSPVPYNFYNTPPVTPQRPQSPHHLQFDGLTTPMSSSRFAAVMAEDRQVLQQRQVPQRINESNMPISTPIIVKPDPEEQMYLTEQSFANMKDEPVTANHVPTSIASQPDIDTKTMKRPAPIDYSSSKKTKILIKGSKEYVQKRERNNVAVRRSRDKAKRKAAETQVKVDQLQNENLKLHEKVAELTHELTTLKNLLKALPHAQS
uniref:CCAAT enhancer binding protein alpha/gamma homolog n=1 Tax=Ciona intestinalis TaxID=7719 RepID=Q4H3U0_CIOIN|nr:CCAAT enhancer binding protein alpha/gamma homolog [Ciona intestinalis]BAE06337.1 CCAAT enhancer binding protein alpha/gamma homolog [Ciona intestinalis]|eukprot:NP_001071988.1 CCAAT enhancer binding protein alpha/gamma homolog [Ciona intestinalis]